MRDVFDNLMIAVSIVLMLPLLLAAWGLIFLIRSLTRSIQHESQH